MTLPSWAAPECAELPVSITPPFTIPSSQWRVAVRWYALAIGAELPGNGAEALEASCDRRIVHDRPPRRGAHVADVKQEVPVGLRRVTEPGPQSEPWHLAGPGRRDGDRRRMGTGHELLEVIGVRGLGQQDLEADMAAAHRPGSSFAL